MLKPLFAFASAAPFIVFACTDSDGSPASTNDGGKTDSAVAEDANASESSTCTPAAPPVLEGAGPCGTLPFGKAAIEFVQTDAAVGEGYEGGVLSPGIYDVVFAERASTIKGSWRETIAVDATGHFSRIRQIDPKGDAAGEVSYWSGTITTDGDKITFAANCAFTGDAGKDASSSTLPYDTKGGDCKGATFRYGAFGIRATFEKR